jgi:hypothetical protein
VEPLRDRRAHPGASPGFGRLLSPKNVVLLMRVGSMGLFLLLAPAFARADQEAESVSRRPDKVRAVLDFNGDGIDDRSAADLGAEALFVPAAPDLMVSSSSMAREALLTNAPGHAARFHSLLRSSPGLLEYRGGMGALATGRLSNGRRSGTASIDPCSGGVCSPR